MSFEDLKSPELQDKLKSCKTTDEIIGLVRAEGVDLTDEQLQALAGG